MNFEFTWALIAYGVFITAIVVVVRDTRVIPRARAYLRRRRLRRTPMGRLVLAIESLSLAYTQNLAQQAEYAANMMEAYAKVWTIGLTATPKDDDVKH